MDCLPESRRLSSAPGFLPGKRDEERRGREGERGGKGAGEREGEEEGERNTSQILNHSFCS